LKKSAQLFLLFFVFPNLLYAEAPRLTSSLTMLEINKLAVSDAAAQDRAGISVAIDGDTAIVGAYGDQCGSSAYCGSAIIYERNSTTGLFEEKVKLTASDGAEEDQFGRSVAISGDTAVVGAHLDDCDVSITDCGAVYVFEKPLSGWADATTENAKLTASDASGGDEFGTSVSVSGDTVVTGAPGNESAYLFEKPGAGGWASTSVSIKLTASDGVAGDAFGSSVTIYNNIVVAGAPNNESAYLFEKPPGGWVSTSTSAILTASDSVSGDKFGSSVSISANTAVVGAHFDDDKGNNSGSAYLFEEPVSGWVSSTQDAKLNASDGTAGDYFGRSVSISGDKVVVGAYVDSAFGIVTGSAYLFQKPATGWANGTQTDKIMASDASSSDWFGYSVGISGSTILIGAYGDSSYASYAGAAYHFEAVVSQNIVENQQTIFDLEAGDEDGDTVSFSLDGGADVTLMNVNPSSGLLSFNTAPDFETPTDANADNIYEATLVISAGGDNTSYRVFVQIGDIGYEGDAPIAMSLKELTKLSAPNTFLNARFGKIVAIDDTTVVVGDTGERAVFVYEYQSDSNSFTKVARLTPSVLVTGWGQSVAIDGDIVVVGATKGFSMVSGQNRETGLAYIFEKPPGGWADMVSETALLSPSDGRWYDDFGASVAVSGDTIIVGAPIADTLSSDIYTNEGAAYIFIKPDSGGWVTATEDSKLIPSDSAPNQYFGRLVVMSGNTLVVQCSTGSYLFEKPLNGWTNAIEKTKLTPSSSYVSAAVDGDTVILGYNGYFAAAYQRPAGGSWNNVIWPNILQVADGIYPNGFGISVGVSGDTVVVGASGDSSAYLFEKPAAGWSTDSTVNATATLTASDGASDDQFGGGVGIFGDTAIIGAPFDDGTTANSGSAYIFKTIDIVAGDLYGDGSLDLKDVIIGLQVLTGENPNGVSVLGDVNEDDKIGMEEMLYDLIELSK